MTKPEDGLAGDLRALGAMVRGASEVVAELAADPLLRRLVAVFTAIPARDRETLLGVLEREAGVREMFRDTDQYLGVERHANPNARLYVRALPSETPPPSDQEEMMLATILFMRRATLLLTPEFHGAWAAGCREAFAHVEPAERAAVAQVVNEFLGMLAEHERAGAK